MNIRFPDISSIRAASAASLMVAAFGLTIAFSSDVNANGSMGSNSGLPGCSGSCHSNGGFVIDPNSSQKVFFNVVSPPPPMMRPVMPQAPMTQPAMPQPPMQQAASSMPPSWCNSPRLNQAESTVCVVQILWDLDSELGFVFQNALNANPGGIGGLRSSEQSWLRGTRNACGTDAGCLQQVYRERIGLLGALTAGPPPVNNPVVNNPVVNNPVVSNPISGHPQGQLDLSALPGCAGACHTNGGFVIDPGTGRKMTANPAANNAGASLCSAPQSNCGPLFCQVTQTCCVNSQCSTHNIGQPTAKQ